MILLFRPMLVCGIFLAGLIIGMTIEASQKGCGVRAVSDPAPPLPMLHNGPGMPIALHPDGTVKK